METVEVVIKIPQGVLNTICAYVQSEIDNKNIISDTAYKAIANGTVLPKGHGRLIDADMVVSDIDTERVNLFMDGLKGTPRGYQHLNDLERIMDEIPTIIEADKEEKA